MKKIIALLTLVMTLTFAGVCLAGENSSALSKMERGVERLVDSLNSANNVPYAEIAKSFAPTLQERVPAAGLTALQKQVAEKFGRLQEMKMVSFERFDEGDRVVYLAGFSRETVVRLVFVFDKGGKMTDFAFTPVQVEAAGK